MAISGSKRRGALTRVFQLQANGKLEAVVVTLITFVAARARSHFSVAVEVLHPGIEPGGRTPDHVHRTVEAFAKDADELVRGSGAIRGTKALIDKICIRPQE